jgi:hypothetical protein
MGAKDHASSIGSVDSMFLTDASRCGVERRETQAGPLPGNWPESMDIGRSAAASTGDGTISGVSALFLSSTPK